LADKLPEQRKLPWNSEDIIEGIKEPERLRDYLKKVVKAINAIYGEISNAFNNLIDRLGTSAYKTLDIGDDAEKPAPGIKDRIYIAVDTQKIYVDDGVNWVVVGEANP
jgi:hypothetical protein